MFRRILAGLLATALAVPSLALAEGCGQCEEEACPRFSLRLEAIGLKRSTPEDRVLATEQAAGGLPPSATVLDATDFGQEFEYGGRLALGYRMSHTMSLELAAYGTTPSEQNKSRNGADTLDTPFAVNGITNNLALPVGFQGASDFQRNEFVEVGFDSSTWSVETNMWNELCAPHSSICARVGGGLRFIELDEDLDYFVDDAVAGAGDDSSFTVDNMLKNRLFGLQVGGGVWAHPTHTLAIGVEAKVGAYANWMERDSNLVRGDGLVGVDEEGSAIGFATVFEVSAETRWDITPNIGLVAGYRFVQVNGAALATENLQFNLSDTGEYQDIRDDGSVYWHGPFVGAEVRF
ncbi:MAG: hypothetical protein AAB434_10145 [Planctomycetota bacterium]